MHNIFHLQSKEVFRVLGDETRVEILQRLISNPATISQLGQELHKHPAQIRYHVNRLIKIGLIQLAYTRNIKNYKEKYYQAVTNAVFLNKALFSWPSSKGQIVILGGDGPALDLLIHKANEVIGDKVFCVIPAGSLDSLIYLRENYCQVAGCHLYDLESEDFNISFIRHLFVLNNMAAITFGYRDQGLMVKKGNPCEVETVQDIVSKKLRFVNRKLGSATRMRIDQIFDNMQIDTSKVKGYSLEAETHKEVGEYILTDRADVGFGLSSVANILGLDFLYQFTERYDLVMSMDMYESEYIQTLISLLQDKSIQNQMEGFGGYDLTNAGKVIYI